MSFFHLSYILQYAICMFHGNYFSYQKPLSRSVKLQAENGKEMLAIHVVSAAIRYMKENSLRKIKDSCALLKEEDVQWVITIFDICSDYNAAKKFMKDAAEKVR